MAEIYIPTEQYRAVVNAIAAMTLIDPDEIKIALGEEGQHLVRIDTLNDGNKYLSVMQAATH